MDSADKLPSRVTGSRLYLDNVKRTSLPGSKSDFHIEATVKNGKGRKMGKITGRAMLFGAGGSTQAAEPLGSDPLFVGATGAFIGSFSSNGKKTIPLRADKAAPNEPAKIAASHLTSLVGASSA